jgi:hypothetical protein
MERAHGGTAAEMSDNDTASCNFGRNLGQGFCNVFVGQPVKAVAAHAFVVKATGDRVVVGQSVVIAVKRGIEAGDLRKAWKIFQERADRRQVVRLMQRRQRCITLQPAHHVMVDQHRPVVVGTAVDHPMSNRVRGDVALAP